MTNINEHIRQLQQNQPTQTINRTDWLQIHKITLTVVRLLERLLAFS